MNIWQVILPPEGSTFLSDDLGLLESVEFEQRIKMILEIINEVEWTDMDPDTITRFSDIYIYRDILKNSPFSKGVFFAPFYMSNEIMPSKIINARL